MSSCCRLDHNITVLAYAQRRPSARFNTSRRSGAHEARSFAFSGQYLAGLCVVDHPSSNSALCHTLLAFLDFLPPWLLSLANIPAPSMRAYPPVSFAITSPTSTALKRLVPTLRLFDPYFLKRATHIGLGLSQQSSRMTVTPVASAHCPVTRRRCTTTPGSSGVHLAVTSYTRLTAGPLGCKGALRRSSSIRALI